MFSMDNINGSSDLDIECNFLLDNLPTVENVVNIGSTDDINLVFTVPYGMEAEEVRGFMVEEMALAYVNSVATFDQGRLLLRESLLRPL